MADKLTVEVSAGGHTTGPMEGGVDPLKVREVVGPTLEEVLKMRPEGHMRGKVKKSEVYLRYDFSHAELLELARELGRTNHDIQRLEGELDAIKKQMNAKIAEAEARRNVLSNQVTNGYDMRMIECEVRFNDPSAKLKTVVRLDTGEIVETRSMDQYECQEELQFEREAGQPEEDPRAKKSEAGA